MRDIRHDGYIGANTPGDHFCSAEAHLFLYGIDNIKPERQFLLIFPNETSDFCNHKATDAVVESPADQGNHTPVRHSHPGR